VSHRTRLAIVARRVKFAPVSEEKHEDDGRGRDSAATRRDLDAGIRDRMADEDMTPSERDARAHAAHDRMAAMQDRQAAARDLAEAEHRRSSGSTDDAEDA
jgi:hypothetical protein